MDPWNTNAWSTDENEEIPDQLAPKWEVPLEDTDQPTSAPIVDLPSWSVASDSVWNTGNDVWTSADDNASNGEPSWNQDWKTEATSHTSQLVEPNAKSPEVEAAVRPALPTPPSSPPTPSISLPVPVKEPVVVTDTVLEVLEPLEAVETPDPFGSFESAQGTPVVLSTNNDLSWSTDLAFETGHSLDEPWKSSWDSAADNSSPTMTAPEDDWEAAQEAQRKLNQKIPQERLKSIISQWEDIAQQHYSNYKMPEGQDYSWRKGLDNVDGLLERVDNLVPSTYFTIPTPFPQSEIAKAVKNALRLTRSCSLSQSSPMGHFFALKGSSEWEDLVKMQGSAAKDEWGWDLKQGKEEVPDPQESVKGPERRSGFLSFWKRRTPSESSTVAAAAIGGTAVTAPSVQQESSQAEKKEKEKVQTQTQPSTPTLPLRSSLENPPSTLLPPKAVLESDTTASLTESRTSDVESQQVQPSVVSRFLNRLSRRPSSVIVEVAESPSPSQIALSVDDLAFLSDIETQPTLTSDLLIPTSLTSTNPLKETTSSNTRSTLIAQSKSPLLPPPPSSSSRVTPPIKHSDIVDLFSDDPFGSSSVDQTLYLEQTSPFKEKPSSLLRPQPPTSLDLFLASSSRSDASLLPETHPRVSQSVSTILPPPPPSRFGVSRPSSSASKLDSSDFDDFDDFVSSGPLHPIKNHLNDGDNSVMADFGDFVSTSHHRPSEPDPFPQPKSYAKNADRRTTASVNIPILKPPPTFMASRLELNEALGTEISPLPLPMGNSRPLGQQTSKPLPRSPPRQPVQTFDLFSATKAPSSRGSTPRPESTSTAKKSGLSAQDLSFFEGL